MFLIVNDEQLTAETMKKDMDWASYGISEVYTAYDTEAARACIAEHPVDILLCDIEMPGENGLGLLRWVRGAGKRDRVHFSHLPCEVCLCSGGDQPGLSGLYPDPGAVRGYRRKDPQSRGSNPGKKRYCPV